MSAGLPTLATLARGSRAVPCRVRVVSGADAGLERPLPAGGLEVGSDPGCGLPLKDRKVSRRHVRIRPVEQGFAVEDLGSTNGTFVDGNVVTSAVVRAGADLHLGGAVLRLLPAEEAWVVEPHHEERCGELVGRSLAMRELFALVDRVAASSAHVLIQGETGAGKDLVARTLHERSPRHGKPFVVVDCGSMPESLIESELFGHVRGAFTGAVEAREGAFQHAEGGTVLLDEIGELPLALQPRFLRVLETGEVRPVGGDRGRTVDVRVLAATHRELGELVEAGQFRADLYYRLAVVSLRVPSLRSRADEDLPLLVAQILGRLGVTSAGEIAGPNLAKLRSYAWPGNVRELRNVLERAVTLAGARGRLRFDELPLSFGGPTRASARPALDYGVPYAEARQRVLADFERAYLGGLLERCEGNIALAARTSGLSRKSLYEMLKRHGIAR